MPNDQWRITSCKAHPRTTKRALCGTCIAIKQRGQATRSWDKPEDVLLGAYSWGHMFIKCTSIRAPFVPQHFHLCPISATLVPQEPGTKDQEQRTKAKRPLKWNRVKTIAWKFGPRILYTVLQHFSRRTTFEKMASGERRTDFPELWSPDIGFRVFSIVWKIM